jgi:hypothetical protein
MIEHPRCPECGTSIADNDQRTVILGPDGLKRHAPCHRAKMASLKDGPGNGNGNAPYAAGSPGYVAR